MKPFTSVQLLIMLLYATSALALPSDFPSELIGKHNGAMGQGGHASGDGTIMFGEDDYTLGGLELKPDGTLVVSFAQKGEEFKELQFRRIEKHIPRAMTVWKPLIIGRDEYSASLHRYGAVFRVLVKLRHDDRFVAGIQWICAEPSEAEP